MHSADLATQLQSAGVPDDAYGIGVDKDEAYCLFPEDGQWTVYYSERGGRTGEVVFADEDAACRELLRRLIRDHVVRERIGH